MTTHNTGHLDTSCPFLSSVQFSFAHLCTLSLLARWLVQRGKFSPATSMRKGEEINIEVFVSSLDNCIEFKIAVLWRLKFSWYKSNSDERCLYLRWRALQMRHVVKHLCSFGVCFSVIILSFIKKNQQNICECIL